MSTNAQLAAIFRQMAELMEILGQDGFRVAAFQRAARSLEELGEDVGTIGADAAKLRTIPGIGEGMAKRIVEFLQTGKIKEHQELLAQVPAGVLELLTVPGLGPKTAAVLWKEAGVQNLEQLKAKLEGEELTKLPGFGAKKLEKLRKSLAFVGAAAQRHRIGAVMPVAQWLVEQLRRRKGVKQAAYAGSLRRGRETVGDLDILVAAEEKEAEGIANFFAGLEIVQEVLAKGPSKTSVRTAEGLQIDLRIVPEESFGAALMYFTGSKEHNVLMRQRALERGLKLNEYGLFRGEKRVAGKTEEEVFRKLGLAWIPPELREARDEIALAERSYKRQKGGLPKLLELSDIRAELHVHSSDSDGTWSIRELIETAIARGFHTVAITDHSVSQVIANGLSAERLEKQIEQVRELAREYRWRITVLAGSEVDILADGRLDYPDSLLKELDIVIASPHVALSQEPEKATARLLKAIENPYVTILGHPMGRLIGRREGLNPDIRELARAAAQRGVALEINANHHRLDLPDVQARMALEAGCKLAINTDAHGPADLDELIYGVLTARRAGATAEDVVNCFSRDELARWIASTRR